MRIVIAGGRGFLGSALSARLAADGHDLVILTRQAAPPLALPDRTTVQRWSADGQTGAWAKVIDGADAIVNLSGESIAGKRWSETQKGRIHQSRLLATHSLVQAIREAAKAPGVLISGSAVGYYGDRGDEILTEASAPGNDFLSGVCRDWEGAANAAANFTRVVLVRTGLVLDRRGGALPKMLPPFYFFTGGPIGSGRQYMPWIHKEDWVRLVSWSMGNADARGAINATAPTPVTNKEFSTALGHALKRPSLMPAPPFALRLLLGEMADALLLSGQRALPARALDSGFSFRFSKVEDAFRELLGAK
ncbi:MAG: TIGR01777 family oxidoreductase [Vicinamibacterales bacterium]|nr:TIGR01777 family oxidoreductase [Vicinamibacterales bacterium]